MTTISELIEYLKTIPLDTEIRVVVGRDAPYERIPELVPLDLDPATGNVTYVNLAGNQYIAEDSPLWDRRFLDFGEV